MAAVSFESVSLAFDDNVVLRDVSFSVPQGHMAILLGASGSGKSVVLKLMLGLLKPDSGVIRINGIRIDSMTEHQLIRVRDDIGMLFQETALFDSLTVAENVGYKLSEESNLPGAQVRARVEEVLAKVGLTEYIDKMPSDISGGQRRRVALARALAAWPRLLLLDEPTSGLDPVTAKTIDAEIITLRDIEGVTSVIATHQLPDAVHIADHAARRRNGAVAIVPGDTAHAAITQFIVLKNAGIYFRGPADEMRASNDAYLRTYLSGWIPPIVAEQGAGRLRLVGV